MASRSVLALDVGDKRVGIAAGSLAARLPRPLTTLERGSDFFDRLQHIITEEEAGLLVVGLPRNLSGQPTAQTRATEAFASEIAVHTHLPMRFQDEALTSQKAEQELESRGKPFGRGDIDALAAAYILEDFFHDNPTVTELA